MDKGQAKEGQATDNHSWEHGRLTKIAEALGVEEAPWYPSDVFHHIWTLPHDYTAVASIKSERCPNLDR